MDTAVVGENFFTADYGYNLVWLNSIIVDVAAKVFKSEVFTKISNHLNKLFPVYDAYYFYQVLCGADPKLSLKESDLENRSVQRFHKTNTIAGYVLEFVSLAAETISTLKILMISARLLTFLSATGLLVFFVDQGFEFRGAFSENTTGLTALSLAYTVSYVASSILEIIGGFFLIETSTTCLGLSALMLIFSYFYYKQGEIYGLNSKQCMPSGVPNSI